MQRYVAFLRGINLGNRRLPMSRLRDLFEGLGFEDVRTFIASGNVLFSSKVKNTKQLESMISKHLEKSLSYEVDTFVRTFEEVAAIGCAKVFDGQGPPKVNVYVGMFRDVLAPAVARKLSAVRSPEDQLCVLGREFYWLCRVRSSDSNIWKHPDIKALKLPTSTMRNMTSLRKLIAQHIDTPKTA